MTFVPNVVRLYLITFSLYAFFLSTLIVKSNIYPSSDVIISGCNLDSGSLAAILSVGHGFGPKDLRICAMIYDTMISWYFLRMPFKDLQQT